MNNRFGFHYEHRDYKLSSRLFQETPTAGETEAPLPALPLEIWTYRWVEIQCWVTSLAICGKKTAKGRKVSVEVITHFSKFGAIDSLPMNRACKPSCFSCVWLFETQRTVAHQAPLSMGFSRQEYWNGLQFPTPGDLPNPGNKSVSVMSPSLAGGFFTTSCIWETFPVGGRD